MPFVNYMTQVKVWCALPQKSAIVHNGCPDSKPMRGDVSLSRTTMSLSHAGASGGSVLSKLCMYIRDCIRMYRVIHEMDGPRAIRALVKPRSEISLRSTRATEDGTIMQASTSKHPRLEIVKKSFPYRALTACNRRMKIIMYCICTVLYHVLYTVLYHYVLTRR